MTRTTTVLGSAAVGLTLVMPAQAAELDDAGGTLQVAHKPIMTNGTLSGCSLLFNALVRDPIYHLNHAISVSGSVSYMVPSPTKAGVIVKIAVMMDNPSGGDPLPSPPTRAYIIGETFKTNLDSMVAGSGYTDNVGGFSAVYALEPSLGMILAGLQANKLTFGFNQSIGSMDIELPIELDVAGTGQNNVRVRNNHAPMEFVRCAMQLTLSAGGQ